MKNFFVAAISLSIFLGSCTQKKPLLVTYDVHKSDYVEKIAVTGTLKAVNSYNIMAPHGYMGSLTVGWVKPEGSKVEPGDTICIMKCPELMQQLDEQERNLKTQKAEYEKLVSDNALKISMLEASLKENLAGMSINQLDSIQMLYAPPLKKRLMALGLEKARVEEKKLQKKFLAEQAISKTEIRQMKSRILQAENQLESMQEKVRQLTITAPVVGVLSAAETQGMIMVSFGDGGDPIEMGGYPKPGGMLFSELPLMAVPDLSAMQVKIEVPEVDYKRIEKGQKVDIIIYSAGDLKTSGSVVSKSLAPKYRYYSREGKEKYFEAVISVDSVSAALRPGFSAGCTILVNNIKDTLVVPSLAIFEKDSSKVVYVAEGSKFRPVPVETGLYNSSQTIISKGLTGKETIALVEPPHNYILKPKSSIHE